MVIVSVELILYFYFTRKTRTGKEKFLRLLWTGKLHFLG